MSNRPPVFILGITVGDYLLWNWSLNGNHDVLALISGLTLPPLAVACVWLTAVSIARLLGRGAAQREDARRRAAAAQRARRAERAEGETGSSDAPPRKLAA